MTPNTDYPWLPNGGQVGRLHKSQGQITIAVFTIIVPFGFAVTDFLGVDERAETRNNPVPTGRCR